MKVLVILMIGLITSSVSSQTNKDFSKGFDFTGYGTEPFWDVKVDAEKTIQFNDNSTSFKIKTTLPKYVPIMDAPGFSYIGESKRYSVNVQIFKEECSDGMSDIKNPYSVRVIINDKNNSETMEYKGCGKFTNDYRLNDIWALYKFKGNEITQEQFMKERPYLEFRLSENRMGGNAGCNNFFGQVEVKSNKIVIPDKLGMTMMACPDMEFEREFIKTISGKTLEYKIKKGKLYLYEDGNKVMEFKKRD